MHKLQALHVLPGYSGGTSAVTNQLQSQKSTTGAI